MIVFQHEHEDFQESLRTRGVIAMKRLSLLLVAVAFISGAVALGQGAAPYDLVPAGVRVIDPGSGLDAVRHVAITGGSIRNVSTLPLQGRVTIDVAGLVVAPGFVDLHRHGQTPENYLLKAAASVTRDSGARC